MIRSIVTLTVMLGMVFGSAAFATEPPSLPLTTARRLPDALSPEQTRELIWKQPASIPALVRWSDGILAKEETSIILAYDSANFYVACTCMESKMPSTSGVVTSHDGPVFGDDSIEVFLDAVHNSKNYFHVVGSISGARFDQRDRPGNEHAWDGPWSTEVERKADRWRILMVIPFQSLEATEPKPGTLWGMQVNRNEIPHTERSQWSPTTYSLHMPQLFGDVLFGGWEAMIASTVAPKLTAPKANDLTVDLSNPSDHGHDVEALVACGGKEMSAGKYTCPPGSSRWVLKIDVPPANGGECALLLKDTASGQIVLRDNLTVDIQDHRLELARLARVAKRLNARSSASRKAKTELTAMLRSADELAAKGQDTQAACDALGKQVEEANKSLARTECLCNDTEGSGFALGTQVPTRKIFRDGQLECNLGGKAVIEACRNEFESVQVVVVPYDRALDDVSATLTSLKGPEGASISAANVSIKRVEYVEARTPCYAPSTRGWHPDPLMDFKTFSVRQSEVQPLWVTVHTPRGIPAGDYKGKLTVKPSNAPSKSIDVVVHVWDFDIPVQMHLKTAFSFSPWSVEAWYGKPLTEQKRREWFGFLLDHHINPTCICSSETVPKLADVGFCVGQGMNAFNLTCTSSMDEKALSDYISRVKPYETLLKKNQWWDKAYIYGFDEVQRDNYPKLRAAYAQVKNAFPDLARMCTVVPSKDLKGYVDIWVPITSNFKAEDAEQYTKAGDQVWWYVCCWPVHPFANFFLDYTALEPRLLFWMNWKYHVPGFLYYAIDMWGSNMYADSGQDRIPNQDASAKEQIRAGKRWPDVPWNSFTYSNYNGDGQLIYPGPGMKPVSSIRLECIRDGIEDYEYFYILSKLLEKAERRPGLVDVKTLRRARELLAVPSALVKSLTEYTSDSEAVMSTRREVANTIVEMRRSLAGG